MHKLFLWFYCLPIVDAVVLIALATMVFLLLRKKFRETQFWKVGISILFLFWIAAILFGTLGQRIGAGSLSEPILTPFASYRAALQSGNRELYRTNFMNAVLFYPAGLLGCEVFPKDWKQSRKVILIPLLFALASIGIEYAQYRFGLGLAETDDVIHNTLGTVLGFITCYIPIKIPKK